MPIINFTHHLLRMRTRVLNGELDQQFRQWYPQFRPQPASTEAPKVAA